MRRVHLLLSNSGGPDNLLSRRAKRAGGRPRIFDNLWATSCGLRPPGQQVVRATRKGIAFILFSLLLAAAPLTHAQTDATNAAPASTDSPPAATPPPAVQNNIPSAQVTSPGIPGQPPQPDDIDDIRPPFFFFDLGTWILIALAAAAFIALLVLFWKWLRRSPFLSPKTAYELTLEKLEKARELLREDDPVPYAVFVSETIRTYLGQRFQTPSTRRTTEEFLRMMEADKNTPLAEHSELLRDFLQACDLVKFAKYQPTLAELEQVQQRAFTFVHATKPAPESTTTRKSS